MRHLLCIPLEKCNDVHVIVKEADIPSSFYGIVIKRFGLIDAIECELILHKVGVIVGRLWIPADYLVLERGCFFVLTEVLVHDGCCV
jgi:hypothetical protein